VVVEGGWSRIEITTTETITTITKTSRRTVICNNNNK
jgi:hypothetical protein